MIFRREREKTPTDRDACPTKETLTPTLPVGEGSSLECGSVSCRLVGSLSYSFNFRHNVAELMPRIFAAFVRFPPVCFNTAWT